MIKRYIFILAVIIMCAASFGIYKSHVNNVVIDGMNICQNEMLINKYIDKNSNPFSKFRFIKKRNSDCRELLVANKEEAVKKHDEKYCSYLDSSTNSLLVLIHTYVHEMYDRETASKELKLMTPLMTPYEYCPQYIDNMITLITVKKKLGL